MSVARAMSEIDSREFTEWLAYYRIEAREQVDAARPRGGAQRASKTPAQLFAILRGYGEMVAAAKMSRSSTSVTTAEKDTPRRM